MALVRLITRGIFPGPWVESTESFRLSPRILTALGVSEDEVVHSLIGPEDQLFVDIGRAAAVVLDALDRLGIQDRMVFSTWRHRVQERGPEAAQWLRRLIDLENEDGDDAGEGLWWPQDVGWISACRLRAAYLASGDWDCLTLLAWRDGASRLLDEIAEGLHRLDRRPF